MIAHPRQTIRRRASAPLPHIDLARRSENSLASRKKYDDNGGEQSNVGNRGITYIEGGSYFRAR